jgi:NAD(P)-dependent dehydrogenase (short-subunit alcohol dehydrogenase family)
MERACVVVPRATEADLAPLISYLMSAATPTEPTVFPRGTLLPDGRPDLCKQGVGPDGARLVARALGHNDFVRSLLLGADALGDDGARAIGERVAESRRLETLFLGCNNIGSDGMEALAAALRDHPTMRALWIKRNAIGARGLGALLAVLPSTKLRTLDLAQIDLRAGDGDKLAAAVRASSLRRLYLSGNRLGPGAAGWIASLMPSLHALYIGGNDLGDDGAAVLAEGLMRAEALEVLSLGSNGFGARGLAALGAAAGRHRALRTLDLRPLPAAPVLAIAETAWPADVLLPLLATSVSLTRIALPATASREERAAARALGRRNRDAGALDEADDADVRAIRSVYRTVSPPSPKSAAPSPSRVEAPTERVQLDADELARCTALLEQLARDPDAFERERALLAPLRAATNRALAALQTQHRHNKRRKARAEGRAARARISDGDRAAVERRLIRGGEGPAPERGDAAPDELSRARECYVCKRRFHRLDHFYDALCPSCAASHFARRDPAGDLSGRTMLITGGRVKIGHEAALLLLRAGACVHVTTRFPVDALARFGAAPDCEAWLGRLHVHGLDLRDLRAVDRFAARLDAELPSLEALINNAAQTVRRPPASYADLVAGERRLLAPSLAARLDRRSPHMTPLLDGDEATAISLSARASLLALLPGDDTLDPEARHNSWTLRLGDIDPVELVETHAVSALAPFLLANRLLPALRRSRFVDRHIVNVSAVEGKFSYANKQPEHPHTNMAKAALNMLTRTAALGLDGEGIFVNSVDTGWITNEKPAPIAARMRAGGFAPPLDERDGAARVVDPIFTGARTGRAPSGRFLKDFLPTPW